MKKTFCLILLILGLTVITFGAGGRYHDRDWAFSKLNINGAAVRVTNPQSGMLFVENHGATAYIAFNATANVSDIQIANGGSIDMYPASVRYGEYFTIYSAGATSINYVILD